MKFLLDTNVYVEAAALHSTWQKFEKTIVPILPFVYLSSVVVFELSISSKQKTENLINAHVASLKKVGRIVTPTNEDWCQAASLMKGKKLRSQLCDVLLAQCARQIGAVLFTFDVKDFNFLSKKLHFSIQRPWE